MERSIQKNGLINLLALLAVGVAGLAVARYANSLAGQVSVLFLGIGVLVAAVSWFQMRLEDRERLEKLELDELAKTHGGSALFEARDAEVFPAQRSREQFERFFVPAFTVLLFLLQAGGAYLLWRWLSQSTTASAVDAAHHRAGAVWPVRAGAVPARPVLRHHCPAGASPAAAARGQLPALQRLPVPGRGAGHGRRLGRLSEGGLLRRARPVRPAGAGGARNPGPTGAGNLSAAGQGQGRAAAV